MPSASVKTETGGINFIVYFLWLCRSCRRMRKEQIFILALTIDL